MNKIPEFLREHNMSQGELARRMKVDPSLISRVVNGKRPINDAFRWRWVETFGPSSIRVLNGSDEAKP